MSARSVGMMFVAAVCSILISLLFNFLFKVSLKAGPMIVGLIIGFFTTLMLEAVVDAILNMAGDIEIGLFGSAIIAVLGSLLGIFLGYRLSHLILLIAQAIISGYAVMRGISILFGSYPSESEIIMDLFENSS